MATDSDSGTPENDSMAIPVVWVEQPGPTTQWANQFTASFQPEEVLLIFGQGAAPILAGTEEQQREQLKNVPFIPINTVAKIALTRRRAEELLNVLQQTLANHDAAKET